MSNVLFFFSSRRRHTMWTGDWSSDVCSSDLAGVFLARPAVERRLVQRAKQGDEMAAGRLAPDAEMVGVELTVLGDGAQVAHRLLTVLDLGGESRLLSEAVVDAGDGVAASE